MIKYLLKLWIFVLLSASVFCCVVVLFINLYDKETSEDFPHAEFYRYMLLVYSLSTVIFLSICSIGMFLNGIKKIRDRVLTRWLSFYVLPLIFLYIEISPISNNVDKIKNMLLPEIMPFFTVLTIAYLLFSKKIKRERMKEKNDTV